MEATEQTPAPIFNFTDVLRVYVQAAGSQRAAAARLGLSPAYLSDILTGKRAPGKKALAALGFNKVVAYYKTEGENDGRE